MPPQQHLLPQHFQPSQSEDANNSTTSTTRENPMDATGASTHSSASSTSSDASLTPADPNSSQNSPAYNLSLPGAQQDAFNAFAYGSAHLTGTNWENVGMSKSPIGPPFIHTPHPIAVGSGGEFGFHQYPMSIFA